MKTEAKMVMQLRHPDWHGPILRFEEQYTRLSEAIYPIVDVQRGRQVYGRAEMKMCCFCGDVAPKATFKKEAHLIPASVGNRIHFSLEECDSCNQAGGEERENHLARFLDPFRSLFAIPGRRGHGSPEFKLPGAQASIRRGPLGGPRICLFEGDDSIEIEHPDDNAFSVVVRERPAYRGMRAMQSLLRSAWMSISAGDRKRYGVILSHIGDQVPVYPFEFWQFLIPGPLWPFGKLTVWAKREESSASGAEIVVDFRLANLSLTWFAPSSASQLYEPTLFPPLDVEGQIASSANVFHHKISDGDPVCITKGARFSFAYGSRIEQVDGIAQKSALEQPLAIPVDIEIENASGTGRYGPIPFRVDSRGGRVNKLRLGDETTSVFIALHIGRRGQKLNETIHFQPKPARGTAEAWLETCIFFARLADPLSRVTIIREGERILFPPLNNVPELGTLFVTFRDDPLLQELIAIGRAFDAKIRFPEKNALDSTTRMKIHILAGGIRHGRVGAEFPGATLLANESEAEALEDSLSRGSLVLDTEMPLSISGVLIDPGPVRVVVPNVRIKDRHRSVFPDGSPAIKLVVASERATYEFERWLPVALQSTPETGVE